MKIVKQDRHRNGVGGAPFVVSLFTEGRDLRVAVSFTADCTLPEKEQRAHFIDHTAVLDVGQLVLKEIAFAGPNSWRGSDTWGPALADAWNAKVLAEHGFPAFEQETALTPEEADIFRDEQARRTWEWLA